MINRCNAHSRSLRSNLSLAVRDVSTTLHSVDGVASGCEVVFPSAMINAFDDRWEYGSVLFTKLVISRRRRQCPARQQSWWEGEPDELVETAAVNWQVSLNWRSTRVSRHLISRTYDCFEVHLKTDWLMYWTTRKMSGPEIQQGYYAVSADVISVVGYQLAWCHDRDVFDQQAENYWFRFGLYWRMAVIRSNVVIVSRPVLVPAFRGDRIRHMQAC